MRFQTLLCILTCLVFSAANANNGFTIKTVVIDAGHGGKDPGAIGPGKTNEKDVALAVALKLGDYIKKSYPDVNIIYTRKTDVFLELHERAEIANQSKADLFIAVHCNSSTNTQVSGSSSYVLGLHRTEANLEVAKRENAVILLEENRDKNYEFDPNTPEGHIIMSMKQNAFLEQSISFAQKVENFYESYGKRKSLGVKQAGFYVLYKTTMPSILSEIGFISNPDEEKFLNTAKGQDLIANSLFRAFSEYKIEMEQSEGEQFAMEQALNSQSGSKDSGSAATSSSGGSWATPSTSTTTSETKTTKTTSGGSTGDNSTSGSTSPSTSKTTTSTKTTKTEIGTSETSKPESVKTEPAKTDDDYITVSGGKKIRKPVESGNGGGISAKETKTTTTTEKTETKPASTTSSTKPAATENKTTTSTTTSTTKTSEKTESKPAAATTTTESKPSTSESKPISSTEKTENKPSSTESKPAGTTTTEKKPASTTTKTTTSTTKTETEKPVKTTASGSQNGVIYKVQLCALKGELKDRDRLAKLLNEISTESLPSGLIRYYGGKATSYSDAQELLNSAKGGGFPTAFLVVFKNGTRLTGDEMKPYIK